MNILITGGTGFVGRKLMEALQEQGHHVYILTRSPENQTDTANLTYFGYDQPASAFPAVHAVINLAGESLFGYWTRQKKADILASRLETTAHVLDLIKQFHHQPGVLISGSAVGYYGMSEDLIFTEKTARPGNDFLAHVAVEWENAAKQAEALGIRTVLTRFGVILGEAGALPYMRLPVKLFCGGKIGDGEQWMSWVHIEDVVGIILFCLYNSHISGPVNVTAPHPKRNKDFMKTMADVLHRPYWLTSPALLMRTAAGEMGQLITKGQYVLPKQAKDNNYQFVFPYLKDALQNLNR